MVKAYVRGTQENGQIATAKHFPGHGDTSQDSHLELPVVDVNRERLDRIELLPFRKAVEAGVEAMMTAHIYLPQLEPEAGVPASISYAMTTELLRKELGFAGLIFTDAMIMQGVAAHYTPEDATLRAVKAGADLVLMPVDVERSFCALKQAAETGEIPLARIEASVRRILQAKARLGLHQERQVNLDELDSVVGKAEHVEQALAIIEHALTLVRDEKKVLPLRLRENQRLLHLNIVDSREGWREGVPGRAFRSELLERHPSTLAVDINDATSKDAFEVIKKLAGVCDVIVASGFIRIAAYKGSIEFTEWQLDLIRHLSELDKPFVFVQFGSPYLFTFVPQLPNYILTYEDYPEAERAAVRAVLGEIPFRGSLPVSLPGYYNIGHGLKTHTGAAPGGRR